MRLTWKDAVAAVVMAVMTVIYGMFLQGTELPIIDNVRGAAGTILVLGMIGGCGMSRGDLYAKSPTPGKRFYDVIASLLGVAALVAALIALITASEVALGVFFFVTATLWLIATLRHALSVADKPTHEMIR